MTFSVKEYRELKPREYVSDNLVDFVVRYIVHQQTLEKQKRVLVLESVFFQHLDLHDRVGDDDVNELRNCDLWEEGSPDTIILPLCHHNHWIVLVTIFDLRLPQMYVLDSLGG